MRLPRRRAAATRGSGNVAGSTCPLAPAIAGGEGLRYAGYQRQIGRQVHQDERVAAVEKCFERGVFSLEGPTRQHRTPIPRRTLAQRVQAVP